jgi:hypothetical protein
LKEKEMPGVELTVTTTASKAAVWNFVEDMDNWAPFLTGYQRHEKVDATESLWILKGELGGLTRVAELKVLITEWNGRDIVRFKLEGLDEPLNGTGSFLIFGADAVDSATTAAPIGLIARLRDWFARHLIVRLFGDNTPAGRAAFDHPATALTFSLDLHAGGGMGAIMNLLIAPLLKPVAEDLATKIVARVEENASKDYPLS